MGLIIRELNFQSLPTLKQNGHKFWVVFLTNNKKKLSLSLKVCPFFSMINRAEKRIPINLSLTFSLVLAKPTVTKSAGP